MKLFIEEEWEITDRFEKKQRGKKPLLFLNKYVENGVEKWEYVVETYKNDRFIMFWKKPIENDKSTTNQKDDLHEFHSKHIDEINDAYNIPSKKDIRNKTHVVIKNKHYYVDKSHFEELNKIKRLKQKQENEKQLKLWNMSPLSIKLFGNPELYNPNYTDEENAAMFYCSEWSRKLVTFGNESIFDSCLRLYNVDLNKIQTRMTEISVSKTKGKKFSWHVIQPYIYEKNKNIYHYLPKTIIKALSTDNIDRRMRITPEIEHLYTHSTNANILGTYESFKDAKREFNDLDYNEVDLDFIKKMNFSFLISKCDYIYDEYGNYHAVYDYLSDEELIEKEVLKRIENMKLNGLWNDNVDIDVIYQAVEEKHMKKYNIENFLHNFSSCYKTFMIDDIDKYQHKQKQMYNIEKIRSMM